MVKHLLALLAGMVLCAPAWAADGDPVPGTSTNKGSFRTQTIYLCDTKVAGATTCNEFDTNSNFAYGQPYKVNVSIQSATDCSATPEVTIRGLEVSGGSAFDIITLTEGGTESAAIVNPTLPIYDASLADMTDCTDLTVYMKFFYLIISE